MFLLRCPLNDNTSAARCRERRHVIIVCARGPIFIIEHFYVRPREEDRDVEKKKIGMYNKASCIKPTRE